MTSTRVPAGVQVLHKTIDVLDDLRSAPAGLSLADLTTRVGIPKPTVYRILATLEAPRDRTAEQRLLSAARPVMEELCKWCKETLNVGILDDGEVLVIDTVESPQAVRMPSKIGNRRYPHSTGMGKVLLAHLPHREMLRLVRSKGMLKCTGTTSVKEKDLIVELERVRTSGYALDNSENDPDGGCIAAPILDSERKVVAALSISGPSPRMTEARAKSFLKGLTGAYRNIAAGSV